MLSPARVVSRAAAMAPPIAGRPPAAAGTMLSRPITPTSNAFDAFGTATVVSASMAKARAAFVGPVTDAVLMRIALTIAVDCTASTNVTGVCRVVAAAVTPVVINGAQMNEQ